jgi:hypothetical protein
MIEEIVGAIIDIIDLVLIWLESNDRRKDNRKT